MAAQANVGTAQGGLEVPPPLLRRARERARRVRRDLQRARTEAAASSGPTRSRRAPRSALDHGRLSGAGDGQILGLQAYTGRGDTLRKARAQHKGQARGPRRVPGETAHQPTSSESPKPASE